MVALKPKIGLETHLQLLTAEKMFSSCPVAGPDALANTAICPVSTGQPGTLPVPNEEAIRQGIRMASALGCKLREVIDFDRKNYFYPDLPKGYQITQYHRPLGEKGKLVFHSQLPGGKAEKVMVGIERLHLEEDTGKLMHGKDGALLDLNRAGVPLAEIVTTPSIATPLQAKRFVQELQRIARMLNVSGAELENGQMRIDVNVSLTGPKVPAYKVELKNLNSFASIEKALEFEIKRQAELIEKGEIPRNETRGWSDKGFSVSQRTKEGSSDYRYFREPDIPNLDISRLVKAISSEKFELPIVRQERLHKAGLTWEQVFQIDALAVGVETLEALVGRYPAHAKWLANLAIKTKGELFLKVDKKAWEKYLHTAPNASEYSWQALEKAGFPSKIMDLKKYFAGIGFITEGGRAGDVERFVTETIAAYPDEVHRYREGKVGLIGFLVGKTIQSSGGKLSPQEVKLLLEKKLTER